MLYTYWVQLLVSVGSLLYRTNGIKAHGAFSKAKKVHRGGPYGRAQ